MASAVRGQIKVGIIGAGLIGQTHSMMLRLVADSTEQSVRVTAVADVAHAAAERLAARWPGARSVETADEIIDDPAINAVWICTPTALHRDVCVAAARAGKHIFCEKPLAMSAADATVMAAAIKSAGVMSQVGLVMRFTPVYTVIKSLFEAPEAGRLLSVTMRDDQDFPIRGVHASLWRNDPKLTAGGTLIEHSVHDLDLMTWMFGPIERLYCATRNLNGAVGVEDFAATDLEFAGGVHGQLTSIWHRMMGRPSNRRFEVFAEDLFAASDSDSTGPIILQRGHAAREDRIDETEVMARFSEIVLRERPYLAPLKDQLAIPYALEDATFVAALKGACVPDPEFGAGVAVQKIAEAAYESAQLGRPVQVDN